MLNKTMKNRPPKAVPAFTAPHWAATETGKRLMAKGANAIEAMVGAAATIAVVYPHMNAIGGDGFWLISEPDGKTTCIDASGCAAAAASIEKYRSEGFGNMPALGPKVAATVAGTVDGWRRALDIAAGLGGGLLLSDILADAIRLAENGTATPEHMAQSAASQWDAMKAGLDRRTGFVAGERPPRVGDRLVQPELARTLKRLADHGPRAFYEGDLARDIARDLRRVGSPLTLDDLRDYRADVVAPLSLRIGDAVLHVPPPPSQGVLSLMILATLRRVWQEAENETAKTHLLIEAIKQGLSWRAANLADPKTMRADWRKVLSDEAILARAERIDPTKATPWPRPLGRGDTIWMGAMDKDGRMVGFIQSLYWSFGSGVVLPTTGIIWHNRAKSFALREGHPNALGPGKKPMHTLAPAFADFDDGRRLSFGSMGGDGQTQTVSILFSRHAWDGENLAEAIGRPRFVVGKSPIPGDVARQILLEGRYSSEFVRELSRMGHDIALTKDFDSVMGHAGGILSTPDGVTEAAFDPRGDGAAAVDF